MQASNTLNPLHAYALSFGYPGEFAFDSALRGLASFRFDLNGAWVFDGLERRLLNIELKSMAELIGNLLVAQSGGPTAVINASVAGVIQEAGRHPDSIEEIYGGLNGILGILNEELVDIQEEKSSVIEGLKHTPAAALGTCRYKIDFKKKPEQAARDMDRLFEVFKAHNIRFFFYAGGNDSQDTAHKIHEEAITRGWEMRVIGVPKTIDNDLPHTDHCPGYGSVIKYNATTVMEVAADVGSMATDDGSCCVIEVMGRAAGWIAAGAILAKRKPDDAPHIILLPEIPFAEDAFLKKVQETISKLKYCIVVVGEGLKNAAGEEIAADKSKLDSFGHPVLSGAADRLAEIISGRLKLKTRTVKLGYAQRAAAHCASELDVKEAVACGEAATRAAVSGKSGFMVKIVRTGSNPYRWTTDLHPLAEIANVENLIPRDWISDDGFLPSEKFIEYAQPLIEGELQLPTEGGLPKFATLEKVRIEKKLPAR
jgi:6-phosphofructokinase 1